MCKFDNFASFHVHPQSLDSASTPEAFAKKEVELGTGSLTCTDHGSLGAAYKIYSLAKKNNLIPAISLEGYFRDDNCSILTKNGIQKTHAVPRGYDKAKWEDEHPEGSYLEYNKYYHITLGFRDFKAYKAGVKLLSKADARAEQHGSERKPLFDWADLENLAQYNIIVGSGCLVGMVSRHLLNNDLPQELRSKIAKEYFQRMLSIFGNKMYMEVFPHSCSHNYIQGVFLETDQGVIQYRLEKTIRTDQGEIKAQELAKSFDPSKPQMLLATSHYKVWTELEKPAKITGVSVKDGFYQNECSPLSPDGDLQYGANVFAMGMAKRHKVPVILADDAHFTDPSQKIVQDIRLANSSGGGWKFYNSYHRMSSDEAYEHFKAKHNISEAQFQSWIDNNKALLETFKGFEFDCTPQLPTKFFPSDTLKYTKELIIKNGRMPKDPVYRGRLQKELDVIHRNGKIDLLPYFALAHEVSNLYQNQGKLMGVARGSGGGCLLTYLLGITHLDPIKNDLPFERFLTQTRIESGRIADLDLDFCTRDLLVGYDTDVIEVLAEDGTKRILPKGFKIETDQGLLTVEEAIEKQANFTQWWS